MARLATGTTHTIMLLVLLMWHAATGSVAQETRAVTPAQAQSILQSNPAVTVLDIRTPREFRAGHIKGAVNINFYSSSFRSRLAKLDRTTTYVMHCKRGVRSDASLKVFHALGFTNILHMPAGINGWKRAKLPTVK